MSKRKIDYPDGKEMERTDKIIEICIIENGRDLGQVFSKNKSILIADTFEEFIKLSIKEFEINPLHCVGLPG